MISQSLDLGWVQTFTGRKFFPLNPDPNQISILDIAHSLGMKCRFSGHSKEFYSVGQHSVLVSRVVPPDDALWGLLHDASEAYLPDVCRPIKPMLIGFNEVEERVLGAVARRFGLPEYIPATVKAADRVLLMTEARDLMGPPPEPWELRDDPLPERIIPVGPKAAKEMFLARFRELTHGN